LVGSFVFLYVDIDIGEVYTGYIGWERINSITDELCRRYGRLP